MLRRLLVGLFLFWAAVTLIGQIGGASVPRPEPPSNNAGIPIAPIAPKAGGAPQSASFDDVLYVTANSLNLRAAPTTDGAVISSLPRNYRLEAGERRDGWVHVRTGQLTGWSAFNL